MIKVGTIGTGFITNWLIEAFNNNNCEVVACYSRKLETGKILAEQYGIKKVYTNLELMLNDEEINFIYIASPNSLHFEHAKLALLNNKNVICEKPFTSNARELIELKDIAESKGLYIFEAITTIYNPNFKIIKEFMKKIEPIRIVQCNMSQYSRKYDQFKNGEYPNVFTLKYSGGALMDINIYNIHFLMGLFGKPKSISYSANIEKGIDTSGIISLSYSDFLCSAVGAKDNIGKNFLQIQGENGYIYADSSAGFLKDVTLNIRKGDEKKISVKLEDSPHFYEIKEIIEIFKNNDIEKCRRLLDYSIEVMEVVDACKKSAEIVFEADKK